MFAEPRGDAWIELDRDFEVARDRLDMLSRKSKRDVGDLPAPQRRRDRIAIDAIEHRRRDLKLVAAIQFHLEQTFQRLFLDALGIGGELRVAPVNNRIREEDLVAAVARQDDDMTPRLPSATVAADEAYRVEELHQALPHARIAAFGLVDQQDASIFALRGIVEPVAQNALPLGRGD